MSSTPTARAHAVLRQLLPHSCSNSNNDDATTRNFVSPLDPERAHPSFPVRALTHYLDGGESVTSVKELVAASIEEDPVLNDRGRMDLTRAEARERVMAKIAQVVSVIRGRNEAENDGNDGNGNGNGTDIPPSSEEDRKASRAGAGKVFEDAFYNTLSSIDSSWSIRMGVHFGLFLSAIQGSANSQQLKEWSKKIQEMRIIGCFAMTEMGHGSYLQGLETTATFDPSTDEFILHSPTLTSTKWWIGMAGQTATHAAVFARLILNGEDKGIHTFICPIRDPKTGKAVDGVSVGDMGSKMGRNGLDNGWIRFHHKRIPRTAMLARWAQVARDGSYTPPPNKQVAYNALIGTRVELFSACSQVLKRATTIAIRYALVRKQFLRKDNPSLGETKLLDYPTHQARLFPILSHTFAFHFTAVFTNRLATSTMSAMESSLHQLPELHATTSGLKATGTWYCNDAIESCRQSLGGMGYSSYAGLANMRADWAVMCTWEGDNTVLSLQCARFLIKQLSSIDRGKTPAGVTSYLALPCMHVSASRTLTEKDWLDPAFQLSLMQSRASSSIRHVSSLIAREISSNHVSADVAAERFSTQCMNVTNHHVYAFMTQCFQDGVRNAPKELQHILKLLCDLFVLHHVESNLGDFLSYRVLDASHVASLGATVRHLLLALRPHALSIVDSFALPDFQLDSPLGRFDGDVYHHIFDTVNKAPGAQGITPYFHKLIRPITDPDYRTPEQGQ